MDTSGNIFGCPETLERLWERSSSRIMAEGGAAGEWGAGFFRGGAFLKVTRNRHGWKSAPFWEIRRGERRLCSGEQSLLMVIEPRLWALSFPVSKERYAPVAVLRKRADACHAGRPGVCPCLREGAAFSGMTGITAPLSSSSCRTAAPGCCTLRAGRICCPGGVLC